MLYSILSDIRYSFSYFNLRKFKSIYFYLSIHIFFRRGHPGSAGFHCILEPLSLHMCHGSLTALQPLTSSVCFSAIAKQNQKPKNKTRNKKKNMTRPNSLPLLPPLGCAIFFFWFLVFLVSYFLVRCWFFLQWLTTPKTQKKNKKPEKQETKQPKKKDKTQLSATTPPLGVCNLFFLVSCFFGFLFPGSLLVFSAMANNTKNPKKNKKPEKQETKQPKKKDKTQLSATTPPLGCAILFFFGLFVYFFWFLGFWVSCFLVHVFLFEGLRTRIQLFASSPTLGVANLLLVDFVICFGPVVTPSEFPIQIGNSISRLLLDI